MGNIKTFSFFSMITAGLLMTGFEGCEDTDDDDTPSPTPVSVDADGDGYAEDVDCNDNDASIHPDASEICDGVDQNCDGNIDEGVLTSWYLDTDSDGVGTGTPVVSCTSPDDNYASSTGDCAPFDPTVYPGSDEACDSRDNNCDGSIDENSTTVFYQDNDDDGFGSVDNTTTSCPQPEGYVRLDGDCNDQNAEISPIGYEICDGVDNNCNGTIDDGYSSAWYLDSDGDGFGDSSQVVFSCESPGENYVEVALDCDDTDPTSYPYAEEICDGKDNDCTGLVDEGFEIASYYYQDLDKDGFGNLSSASCTYQDGYLLTRGDCDDNNSNIHPGATDSLSDGIDYDCGGADTQNVHVGYPSSIFTSIQDAIDTAEDGSVVWVGPGTYFEHDLNFHGKKLTLSSSHFSAETIIDANYEGRVAVFDSGESLETIVDGFTMKHGVSLDKGGSVFISSSSPSIYYSNIRDNSAPYGAGIYVEDYSALVLANTTIANNGIENCIEGGGVYAMNSAPVLLNAWIDGNKAQNGAGIAANMGAPVLDGSTIINNVATALGGGVYSYSSAVVSYDSSISNNTSLLGGGVYFDTSAGVFYDTLLSTNKATDDSGGGIYIIDSSPVFSGLNCIIEKNIAKKGAGIAVYGESIPTFTACNISFHSDSSIEEGGGVYSYGELASPIISASTISSNKAVRGAGVYFGGGSSGALLADIITLNIASGTSSTDGGGGVYINKSNPILGTTLQILGNEANKGGGVAIFDSTDLEISETTVSANVWNGSVGGGGIYMSNSSATVENASFTLNLFRLNSTGYGGAIALDNASSLVVSNSLFTGNTAPLGGGAVGVVNNSHLSVNSTTLSANSATSSTGSGGALSATSGSYATNDVVFLGNTATSGGGAIYANNAEVSIENSYFKNTNSATKYGGAFYLVSATGAISNSIFNGNYSLNGGAGYISSGSVALKHIVVVNNSAYTSGGVTLINGATSQIYNSIFSYNTGNKAGDLFNDTTKPSNPTLTNNAFYTTSATIPSTNIAFTGNNVGNMLIEPKFLSYDSGKPDDLHLLQGSPLVDKGSASISLETDVDGSLLDIGAYGGSSGGLWDLDIDGYFDYFWPGEFADVPSSVNISIYDCNDWDFETALCN